MMVSCVFRLELVDEPERVCCEHLYWLSVCLVASFHFELRLCLNCSCRSSCEKPDKTQQRTFEHFDDFPEVVEQPVLKAFSHGKVQQRLVEQMIEVPKDLEQKPNPAEHWRADSRCSRAADY